MKKNIITSIVVIFFITILTKVLGFSREIVLASHLGVSTTADAYFTAISIPIVLFSVVVSALGSAFMPMYYEKFKEYGQNEADKFASNVLNHAIILSLIITIVGFVFSKQIVKIFVPGFSEDMIFYTANITKYLFLTLVFSSISGMFASILQSRERVITISLLGIPMNIIIILATVFYYDEYGIKALIIANFISILAQILLQGFSINKIFKYKLILRSNNDDIKKLVKLIGPVIITTVCIQMNLIIDKVIGSFKGNGAISTLNYANKIITIISGLFIITIISVYYPKFMKYSSKDKHDDLVSIVNDAKRMLSLIVIPGTLLLILLSENFVNMMFIKDNVEKEAIEKIRNVLIIYAMGLPSLATREVMIKVAYSIQKHRYVMINSILSLLINLFLNLLFGLILGVEGIALATTISTFVTTLYMNKAINKFINADINNKEVKEYSMSILLPSILAGIVAVIVKFNTNFNNNIINILAISVIFFIIYIVMILILNIGYIKVIFDKRFRVGGGK